MRYVELVTKATVENDASWVEIHYRRERNAQTSAETGTHQHLFRAIDKEQLAACNQSPPKVPSSMFQGGRAGTSRSLAPLLSMKIRSHSESHLVELDDGSKWQIFPGDLDVTLNWKPTTELKLVRIYDPVSSHALVSRNDNSTVRVLPVGDKWPVDQVRTVLKDNQ